MPELARSVPWIWTGSVGLGSVAAFLAQFDTLSNDLLTMGYYGLPTLYSALGSLIVTRRGGQRIGWLLFAVGTGGLLTATSPLLMPGAPPGSVSPGQLLALVWDPLSWWIGLLLPIFLLLFLFPTGRFLSQRWSWAGWVAVVFASQAVVSAAFRDQIGPELGDWAVANPIGFLSVNVAYDGLFGPIFGLSLVALLVGGVIAMAVRYRRSTPIVRTQIKWVAYATTLFAVVMAGKLVFADWQGVVPSVALISSLYLIPVSITVAIIRYRLFDIDRIISRTVGYALVVATLAGVYAIGAVWLPAQLLGEQPPLFVAASTLAVAALFSPVRRRILAGVDRRFHRSAYEAQRVVGEFGGRLQEEVEVDLLAGSLETVVRETMQPSAIGVWVPWRRREPTS